MNFNHLEENALIIAIDVQGLTKFFGRVVAVDHVNFSVQRGEIVGLLGPNGAGKTTTLRILTTVLRPTEGTAKVNGYDVLKESRGVRESIGVLPEDAGLYDRLTPRETLRYYARLSGMKNVDIENKIDELLDMFELKDREKDRVSAFSKGMRQKLALARALIHDPPILFLDEPTAGLDVISARAIRQFITKSTEKGKTVLLSTHNMVEAQQLCGRIVMINKGRIVAEGTIGELETLTKERGLEDVFVHLIRAE